MFPIQSLGVECEVCLSHAGDLRWQNLFLVIVERAIIYIGAGKCDFCPMHALTQYLHVHGSITPSPLFLHLDGTLLNCQWLTSSSHSILSAAGVPVCYTGHSFCIGTTISAASCGLPDHLTKTLIKWFRIRIRSIYAHSSLLSWGSRPTHLTE